MGKKSRRNKENNGGPLRKGLAVVPTAPAPAANIFKTVCRLVDAHNFDKILKVESKYRHLDTFSFDPVENIYVLYWFGGAYNASAEDEACLNRAIHYFERAKERMVYDQCRARFSEMKTTIGINLPQLYSCVQHDMEKSISSHRWLLEKL